MDAIREYLPALSGAASVLVAGLAGCLLLGPGPLSSSMLHHILLMNAAAPLCAVAMQALTATSMVAPNRGIFSLWAATTLHMVLLWAWHAPPALALAMTSLLAHAAMMLTLFGAAFLFWTAVVRETHAAARWRSVCALLITGKLACLLGAILIFAPRLLYSGAQSALLHHRTEMSLADQQLAGLLMIVACPLSYVLAGVLISGQILGQLARAGTSVRATLPVAR